MIFWDSLSVDGHIALNKALYSMCRQPQAEFWVSDELKNEYIGVTNLRVVKVSTTKAGRIKTLLTEVRQFLFLCRRIRSQQLERKLTLLSYSFLLLPIFTVIARASAIKLYVFEHNTVPLGYAGFKRLVLKSVHLLAGKSVVHLCFTDAAARWFESKNLMSKRILHPILTGVTDRLDVDHGKENNVVFCPSLRTDRNQLHSIAAKLPNVEFVVKGLGCSSYDNITFVGWLDYQTYASYLSVSSAVLILVPGEDGRACGPLFEAVALSKRVVIASASFFDSLDDELKRLPNLQLFDSTLDSAGALGTSDSCKTKVYTEDIISDYNLECERRLQMIYSS